MQCAGRERRRKGPINKLRRLLYGLLLTAASGGVAADELAYVGKYKVRQVASATQQGLQFTLQGLVLLHAESAESPETPIQGNAYPRIALNSLSARTQAPAADKALQLSVTVSEGGSIRDGCGFNLAVPDLGNFHLSLYTRRNARTGGKRWSLDLADGDSSGAESRTWSLGGSLEMVRTVDGGRHLAFVPELLVDLDDRQSLFLPFQASVKFSNWRSVSDKQSLEEKVPQITFKWQL